MSNINKRIFTKEDKSLRPRVYIQSENPEDTNDNLFFKIEEEKETEGQVSSSVSLSYTKNGNKKTLNVRTNPDSVILDDGSTLSSKLQNLTSTIFYDTLLKSNWIVGTNDIPYMIKLDYTIPKEYDVFILLNSQDPIIIRECANANIIAGQHLDNTIIINAFGYKPTKDIPIKLVVVERDAQDEEQYELTPATLENLGGIITGDGTNIDGNGSLTLNNIRDSLNELNELSI